MKTCIQTCLCLFAFSLLFSTVNAVPVTFSGGDPGANSTDPRPNSDAAAAAFDLAASAIGTNNIITFESAPVGNFTTLTVAPGVTMTAGGGTQSIRNTSFSSPDSFFGYNTTSGGTHFVQMIGGTVTFTFATAIEAFGAYITGVQASGETITYSDGSSQMITIPNFGTGSQFLGFTDISNPFTSVVISAVINPTTGDLIGLDDVRFAAPAGPSNGVPDGGNAALLFGAALAGLALFRNRRSGSALSESA